MFMAFSLLSNKMCYIKNKICMYTPSYIMYILLIIVTRWYIPGIFAKTNISQVLRCQRDKDRPPQHPTGEPRTHVCMYVCRYIYLKTSIVSFFVNIAERKIKLFFVTNSFVLSKILSGLFQCPLNLKNGLQNHQTVAIRLGLQETLL